MYVSRVSQNGPDSIHLTYIGLELDLVNALHNVFAYSTCLQICNDCIGEAFDDDPYALVELHVDRVELFVTRRGQVRIAVACFNGI